MHRKHHLTPTRIVWMSTKNFDADKACHVQPEHPGVVHKPPQIGSEQVRQLFVLQPNLYMYLWCVPCDSQESTRDCNDRAEFFSVNCLHASGPGSPGQQDLSGDDQVSRTPMSQGWLEDKASTLVYLTLCKSLTRVSQVITEAICK